jgi:lysophospholipase L1-like esterase
MSLRRFITGLSTGSSSPTPSSGSFVPLSWTGDVSVFDFGISASTPNTFNTIRRNSASQSFVNRTIESIQTVPQGTAFTLSGDTMIGNTGAWFSIGQTGLHQPGITFGDLEYALRGDQQGSSVDWEWWESGVKTELGTTVIGNLVSWVIQYDGNNNISVNINNGDITHTTTSSYTTEAMAVYLLGRDPNGLMTDHLALKTVSQPNRIMLAFGDSITFGGADAGGYSSINGSSYLVKTIAYENHRHFINPVLAIPGQATGQMLSDQIPRASDYYNASYDSNLAIIMCGINDLRFGTPLATIQANLSSAVSSLQGDGMDVLIITVTRDHSAADYPDRATLNSWILAGSSGADHILDLTGTDLETNTALFEADLLHPNPDGMTVIAENLWLLTKDL